MAVTVPHSSMKCCICRTVTLQRDTTGEIDHRLAQHHLRCRVATTTPHMLTLPAILATTNLIAPVPDRIASRLAPLHNLALFELPIQTETWTVSMLWSKLADKEAANARLRQTLSPIGETI